MSKILFTLGALVAFANLTGCGSAPLISINGPLATSTYINNGGEQNNPQSQHSIIQKPTVATTVNSSNAPVVVHNTPVTPQVTGTSSGVYTQGTYSANAPVLGSGTTDWSTPAWVASVSGGTLWTPEQK